MSVTWSNFVVDAVGRNYDVITIISESLYFKKPKVTNFPDIIKIATMFIKATLKDSKKVKRIRNYDLKFNLYLYFLIEQKLLIHGKKMRMPAELKGCVMWFI